MTGCYLGPDYDTHFYQGYYPINVGTDRWHQCTSDNMQMLLSCKVHSLLINLLRSMIIFSTCLSN